MVNLNLVYCNPFPGEGDPDWHARLLLEIWPGTPILYKPLFS